MNDPVYCKVGEHGIAGICVDACRAQQCFAQSFSQVFYIIVHFHARLVKEHLAHQGIPIAVDAAGCYADDLVAHLHLGTGDDFIFIHDTHGKSGHIVLAFAVKARHLCCFSTYESTSGLLASVCDPLYDISDLFCRYFTGCDIVQEKQRLCTLAQHVVDAHCHAVDAYGVMSVHEESQFQLGSYAICSGHQHRFLHIRNIQCKEAAEAAQTSQYVFIECPFYVFLHQGYCTFAFFRIHACVFIGKFCIFHDFLH